MSKFIFSFGDPIIINVIDWNNIHKTDIHCRITDYDYNRKQLYLSTDDRQADILFIDNPKSKLQALGVFQEIQDIFLKRLQDPHVDLVILWNSKNSPSNYDSDSDRNHLINKSHNERERLKAIGDGSMPSMGKFTVKILAPSR